MSEFEDIKMLSEKQAAESLGVSTVTRTEKFPNELRPELLCNEQKHEDNDHDGDRR